MHKQPPPLTPEQQAEQVRQFDSVFGTLVDRAVNAHKLVPKKIDSPMIETMTTGQHLISEIAADLTKKVDGAILTALQKRIPVATVADVFAYKDRLSAIQNRDQSTTYYLDRDKLLTIHPPVADFSFEDGKATVNQQIEFHDPLEQ